MGAETLGQETINLIISVSVLLIDLAIRIFLLFYIPRNRKPSSALAWLFAIALIPIGATILFFVIGRPSLSKERRAKQRYINELYQRYNRSLHRAKLDSKVPVKYAGAAKLGEELAYLAPTSHNKIELVGGYDEIIEELTRSVNRAKQYIYVEFFAMAMDTSTDPFFAALELARQRGVKVYVLFDYLGSKKYPNYRKMKKRLTAMGTQWRAMLPISLLPGKYNRPDLRNHRKIVVVDNTEAYLGSLNLIDKTYHRKDDISYIELVAHIEGPTVNESAAVFASDWYAETGEVLHHFMKNSLKTPKGGVVAQVIPSGPG